MFHGQPKLGMALYDCIKWFIFAASSSFSEQFAFHSIFLFLIYFQYRQHEFYLFCHNSFIHAPPFLAICILLHHCICHSILPDQTTRLFILCQNYDTLWLPLFFWKQIWLLFNACVIYCVFGTDDSHQIFLDLFIVVWNKLKWSKYITIYNVGTITWE